MNTDTYISLLEQPEHITVAQTAEVRAVIDRFPFFQSAHALYLKGLKNQESFTYNKALKITAAHTTDRSILFEYITSKAFLQNDISKRIRSKDSHLQDLNVQDAHDVSNQVETEELHKAEQILDPGLFVQKEAEPATALQMGKPLAFNRSETHSFQEWLQMASLKPITREKTEVTNSDAAGSPLTQEEKVQPAIETARQRKQKIVASFIATNPKIQAKPTENTPVGNIANDRYIAPEALMTETLARVYIEQKKFKQAKAAFRILSLKYPEKSGFFADQIRAIEKLEAK